MEDDQLKPLLVSYLGIKAIMQNDTRIFEHWQLSFDNLAEELNNSVNKLKIIPEEELIRLNKIINEIKNQRNFSVNEE